jgi:hypothetical protein
MVAFPFLDVQLIGYSDKFSVVTPQVGLDHVNSLAGLQAIQVGPRALLRLSIEFTCEPE